MVMPMPMLMLMLMGMGMRLSSPGVDANAQCLNGHRGSR